jgi:hypothetical protein
MKMTENERGKHNPYLYPGLTRQANSHTVYFHHTYTTQSILVPRPPAPKNPLNSGPYLQL